MDMSVNAATPGMLLGRVVRKPCQAHARPRHYLAIGVVRTSGGVFVAHSSGEAGREDRTLDVAEYDADAAQAAADDVARVILTAYQNAICARAVLYVNTNDATTRSRLISLGDGLPGFHFVDDHLLGGMLRTMMLEVRGAASARSRHCSSVTLIATDASMALGRRGAGIAAIINHRQAWMDYVPDVESVLEAELIAIRLALTSGPGKTSPAIIIESDSKAAVALIAHEMRIRGSQLWQPGNHSGGRAPVGSAGGPADGKRRQGSRRVSHAIAGVVAEIGRRRVAVRWVRGHSDHAGNRTADRLAMLARRSVTSGASPDVVMDVARTILDDELGAGCGVQVKLAAALKNHLKRRGLPGTSK